MHALKSLSDRELVSRLRLLVEKEKALTLEIVSHLVEVARRGLHLESGYGSLYEYCTGELGYTDASAWRRARAAQAILRCPEAWERLSEGRVTLCALGRVQKFITPRVLEEICGKAEVEWIAARYDAKGLSPDRMRPVMVPKPAKPAQAVRPGDVPANVGTVLDTVETDRGLRGEVKLLGQENVPSLRGEVGPRAQSEVHRLLGEVTSSNQEALPSLRSEVRTERMEFERKWKVEAVISNQVKAKLDRCKSLLSSKYPRGVDYDILFKELSELFLEHLDPERNNERREQRKANQKRPAKVISNTPAKASPSRHIPASVKQQVWIRDKGRCAYISPNGRRCNSTFGLQIDHFLIPFARGGPSKANNLRLLCARHNRYTAEQAFGGLCYGKHAAQADGRKCTEPMTRRPE